MEFIIINKLIIKLIMDLNKNNIINNNYEKW